MGFGSTRWRYAQHIWAALVVALVMGLSLGSSYAQGASSAPIPTFTPFLLPPTCVPDLCDISLDVKKIRYSQSSVDEGAKPATNEGMTNGIWDEPFETATGEPTEFETVSMNWVEMDLGGQYHIEKIRIGESRNRITTQSPVVRLPKGPETWTSAGAILEVHNDFNNEWKPVNRNEWRPVLVVHPFDPQSPIRTYDVDLTASRIRLSTSSWGTRFWGIGVTEFYAIGHQMGALKPTTHGANCTTTRCQQVAYPDAVTQVLGSTCPESHPRFVGTTIFQHGQAFDRVPLFSDSNRVGAQRCARPVGAPPNNGGSMICSKPGKSGFIFATDPFSEIITIDEWGSRERWHCDNGQVKRDPPSLGTATPTPTPEPLAPRIDKTQTKYFTSSQKGDMLEGYPHLAHEYSDGRHDKFIDYPLTGKKWLNLDLNAPATVTSVTLGMDLYLGGGVPYIDYPLRGFAWAPAFNRNLSALFVRGKPSYGLAGLNGIDGVRVESSLDGKNWSYMFNTGNLRRDIQTFDTNADARYIRVEYRAGLSEFYASGTLLTATKTPTPTFSPSATPAATATARPAATLPSPPTVAPTPAPQLSPTVVATKTTSPAATPTSKPPSTAIPTLPPISTPIKSDPGKTSPPRATLPECNDGIDNDSDGWTDLLDPSCSSSSGLTEQDQQPPQALAFFAEGLAPLGTGSEQTLYISYVNSSSSTITLPRGSSSDGTNSLTPEDPSIALPTEFLPGKHLGAIALRVKPSDPPRSWRLALNGAKPIEVPVSAALPSLPKVQPLLQCVTQSSSGGMLAILGYQNPNSFEISVPVGASNSLNGALKNAAPPARFLPGTHNGVALVPFESSLEWKLSGSSAAIDLKGKACECPSTPLAQTKKRLQAAVGDLGLAMFEVVELTQDTLGRKTGKASAQSRERMSRELARAKERAARLTLDLTKRINSLPDTSTNCSATIPSCSVTDDSKTVAAITQRVDKAAATIERLTKRVASLDTSLKDRSARLRKSADKLVEQIERLTGEVPAKRTQCSR